MVKHRTEHYFLWFILFGLIAGVASYLNNNHEISSEAIWLLVVGVLGFVVTQNWLADGKFSQPFDFIVGVIFTLVGLIGVLQGFHVNLLSSLSSLPSNLVSANAILGLSLTPFLLNVVHLVLGLQSLSHGLRGNK
jgi:hypothetical protein